MVFLICCKLRPRAYTSVLYRVVASLNGWCQLSHLQWCCYYTVSLIICLYLDFLAETVRSTSEVEAEQLSSWWCVDAASCCRADRRPGEHHVPPANQLEERSNERRAGESVGWTPRSLRLARWLRRFPATISTECRRETGTDSRRIRTWKTCVWLWFWSHQIWKL